jgi:hypothetical protein
MSKARSVGEARLAPLPTSTQAVAAATSGTPGGERVGEVAVDPVDPGDRRQVLRLEAIWSSRAMSAAAASALSGCPSGAPARSAGRGALVHETTRYYSAGSTMIRRGALPSLRVTTGPVLSATDDAPVVRRHRVQLDLLAAHGSRAA